MSDSKKKNTIIYNLVFLAICGGLFLFLWNAPPETTHRLPHDSDHERFHAMGKKDAEKFCTECHNPEGVKPLPENHPPKYRCLFCHKKDG
ncbi:MAG: hypothetical protein KKG47_09960 [Proteobacteria bacterium]|nr:hypothetical protein [Pseudomonadota bacterium]MBU1736598.1 hypothetical protein [Pseudomonadota bacterium]